MQAEIFSYPPCCFSASLTLFNEVFESSDTICCVMLQLFEYKIVIKCKKFCLKQHLSGT